MTVQINGNGTITGISVGGLPDGIVDTDMIAANAVTAAKSTIVGAKILQIQSANVASSIQITSTSYATTGLAVNITPTSASSKILISTCFSVYKSSAAAQVDTTLYRDSTNLGQATYGFGQVADFGNYGGVNGINLQYSDSPNTTSQVTYTVYGKVNSGHNFYVMGNNVQANITAMEYSTWVHSN